MKEQLSKSSRRTFLASAAGVIVAPMLLKVRTAAAESNSVTLAGSGGSFQEAYVKCVAEPFTKETGIKVNFIPAPGLDKIKAMELTGNMGLDVHQLPGSQAAFGSKEGLWEKLDPSIFDLQDLAVPPATDMVAEYLYTEGIGWDPKKFGSGKHPTNFAEFFDLKKFPGRRALQKRPDPTLEIALLADGVAPKDIYPLDLDRAFKSLDRIKSSVAGWASTTTQTISLVQTGEVDFSITYTSRVKPSTEPGGGVPLGFSFDQVMLFKAMSMIPKGAPNKDNATKLIGFIMRPEVQARLNNQVVLTPVSKKGQQMLSPDAKKWQPDLSNPNHLVSNEQYWADNYESVNRRFQDWLQA